MSQRFVPPQWYFADAPSGNLFFYEPGTTTPKTTYSDSALSTPNANPVPINASGYISAEIWGDGTYRVILKTAAGTTIWDRDPVTFPLSATLGVRWVGTYAALTALAKPTVAQTIFVEGKASANDGASGPFYWDGASSVTAVTGLIMAADSGGTGRWKRIYSGAVNVRWTGATGDGATNDATAIQAAIDYVNGLSAGGASSVFFPSGVYNVGTTSIVLKNKIVYYGEGRGGGAGTKATTILYSGTGDAVQINNPINASTGASIEIRDLSIYSSNGAGTGAGLQDIGSTFLTISNVGFYGNKYGLLLDQSELVNVTNCETGLQLAGGAGIWLVNGVDHAGGAAGYTNRITIKECQINEGASTYGILDDGGYVHSFIDNNYNGCLNHIRLAGVNGAIIHGGEFESAAGANIVATNTRLSGAGGGVGNSVITSIGALYVPSGGQSAISVTSAAFLTLLGNFFGNTAAIKVVGLTNIAVFNGAGNYNVGGGALLDGRATTHYDHDVAFTLNTQIVSHLATGTAPLSVVSRTPVANLRVEGLDVVATASLPAAGAGQDGKVVIEDAGAGDRNLIIFAGGQRFRIDGGAAF